jgi:hypothetical protein
VPPRVTSTIWPKVAPDLLITAAAPEHAKPPEVDQELAGQQYEIDKWNA